MKRYKILLAIIILIVSIICIISSLIIINRKKANTQMPTPEVQNSKFLMLVTDRDDFYMVKNSINAFYYYYSHMYEEKDIILYDLLDEKYINFKGLTRENIFMKIPYSKPSVINISDMYVCNISENIDMYLVDGILREKESNSLSEFRLMVQIDKQNGTFSILLQDYIEFKHPNLKLGSELIIEPLKNIEKNRYNLYVKEEISDDTYATDLLNKYKEEILYNTEQVYKSLDEQYRLNKFETYRNFKEKADNNKIENSDIKLSKYKKTESDNYNQYVCVDQNGNYYIFRETNVMKYTLILDTYTIDLPEFIEKYNKANTMERVGYNIQKCLDAINTKDYSFMYNKLDFEFKAINYPTLENFEEEIKDKLFDQNKVKSVSSSNEGSIYIYKLIITNNKDNTQEQDMTVIMQLKEGTDFVMSFSFNKQFAI